MVWFGPPPGQIKKLYDIGLPKRIGLVSFITNDEGSNEFSALAATYGGVYMQMVGPNPEPRPDNEKYLK
jgi:hypothetical protein